MPQRAHMVQVQLRARGIADARLLEAMGRIRRELFVPPELVPRAYADQAMTIGHHQTISQPYMVALMTQALSLDGSEHVLEVGTGSGYQAAVLAELARQVYTIERIPELARSARRLLVDELSYENILVRCSDGSVGWPEVAPFQAILVTAAAPAPPPSLLDQLDPDGGRLVVPVGDTSLQHLLRVERNGTAFTTDTTTACRFVPLLGLEGWADDG